MTMETTPHTAMTAKCCHAQGDVPRCSSKGALTAWMKCRTGKNPEIFARVEFAGKGNQSPERNKSTKNTTLVIGPAVSWFGISELMAMPIAEKLAMPTTSTMANATQFTGKLTE